MISIENLKHIVQKQYSVLEFVDLSEAIHDPTVAYVLFQQARKESFGSRERFVFYANGYVGQKTISYLQHAADTFDISRCFILICCPDHAAVSNQFDIEFLNVHLCANEFDNDKIVSLDTVCPLPWMHLEIMNQGNIKACCYTKEGVNRNENITTLNTLFHSPEMDRLRTNLFNGIQTSSCKICWDRESKGLGSLRQWRLKEHDIEFFTKHIKSPRLVSLVLRPSTVCNFKCRSCNELNSSLWVQENLTYENNQSRKKVLQQIINNSKWFDRDQLFSKLVFDLIPQLDYLDIYGGEPLLIKQFKELISQSIKSGSAHKQRLHFNTNASIFPDDLIPMLQEFKQITVSLSIDDIGKRFEVIRGGVWEEIEQNVDKFLSCDPSRFKVSLFITVSNLNMLYLDELIAWADLKKLPFTFNMLEGPEYLRFDRINQQLKERMLQKFTGHSCDFLNQLAQNLLTSTPIDPSSWIDNMRELDHRRNQVLSATHNELCSLMGYDD